MLIQPPCQVPSKGALWGRLKLVLEGYGKDYRCFQPDPVGSELEGKKNISLCGQPSPVLQLTPQTLCIAAGMGFHTAGFLHRSAFSQFESQTFSCSCVVLLLLHLVVCSQPALLLPFQATCWTLVQGTAKDSLLALLPFWCSTPF